jgi:hypothetical protein
MRIPIFYGGAIVPIEPILEIELKKKYLDKICVEKKNNKYIIKFKKNPNIKIIIEKIDTDKYSFSYNNKLSKESNNSYMFSQNSFMLSPLSMEECLKEIDTLIKF